MTAEELRTRILKLIKGYLQRPDLTEQSALLLNCLAGDIMVIRLKKDE